MLGWAPTKRSLHLYAQMLGKLRVELSPRQPNWMFTLLHLDARGITTGAMPYDGTSVEGLLDAFSSEIIVRRSTGDERRIALIPPRTVADVYAALLTALADLGVACRLWPIPQEIPDTTPFDEDTRPAAYDPRRFGTGSAQRRRRPAFSTGGGNTSSVAPACNCGGARSTSRSSCSTAGTPPRRSIADT